MDAGHYGNDWSDDGPYGRVVAANPSAAADTLRDELAAALAMAHHSGFNDVDALMERVRRYADAQVAAERERYERVGCMAGGMLMRGHFGPCNEDGHEPVYRIARGQP